MSVISAKDAAKKWGKSETVNVYSGQAKPL